MGCDIHLYVERKEGDTWYSADEWTPNKYYDPDEQGERPMTVEYEKRFYTSRNYDLFAILANVRNGRGFAGIKTGEGFNPIAPPRGLPTDVSAEVRGESDGWGGDGHSHSWLTIQELLDYDWDQTTSHTGVVDAANYLAWRYEGKPRSWAGDVSGGAVRHVSAEEMEQAISFGPSSMKRSRGSRRSDPPTAYGSCSGLITSHHARGRAGAIRTDEPRPKGETSRVRPGVASREYRRRASGRERMNGDVSSTGIVI